LNYEKRKDVKVNVLMSKQVKTKTSRQCHSHHQKMIKKFGSLENLIEHANKQHYDKKVENEKSRELLP
jgi:hypothetical protein